MKAKINNIKNRKTVEKISELKSLYFEKSSLKLINPQPDCSINNEKRHKLLLSETNKGILLKKLKTLKGK